MNSDIQAENAARDLLRAGADHVHGSADLFDRVRIRTARRRRRRATAGGVLAVVAAVGAVTAALHAGPASPGTDAAAGPVPVAAPSCPSAVPGTVRSTRPGVGTSLVPGTPVVGLACAFSATNGPVRGAEGVVLTGSRLGTIVAALQQPLAQRALRCPAQAQQRQIYLDFRYPQGPDVAVLITPDCPYLSNGTLSGTPTPLGTLPAPLAALTGRTG